MWFNPYEISSEKITPLATLATLGGKNKKVAEVAEVAAPNKQKFVTCGQCMHFKSYNLHGKGSGICTNGEDYGSWSETQHQCTKFNMNKSPATLATLELESSDTQNIPLATLATLATSATLTVICYTPNVKAIEVKARDEEHAAWLIKMNPKR